MTDKTPEHFSCKRIVYLRPQMGRWMPWQSRALFAGILVDGRQIAWLAARRRHGSEAASTEIDRRRGYRSIFRVLWCVPALDDPCRDAVLSLHYFLFWPIWILSVSMDKHGAKGTVFRNYSATFMEQEPFWHKANEVNDSFTKVAVLSRGLCEICTDFMRILSVSVASAVHFKIESCPLLVRPLSASE